jgi:hypothetical protein
LDLNRRDFLKTSAFSAGAALTPNISYGASTSIGALASFLSINPIDLEYKSLGTCCGICPGTVIINHYMPVAFVEVVRGAMDSLVMDMGAVGDIGLANIGHTDNNYLENSFAVRIWDIPYFMIDAAMGGQGCKLCDRSQATPLPPQDVSVAASIPGEIACNGGNLMQEAIRRIMNRLTALFPFQCVPQLMYDSNFDISWRNGCRDIATATAMNGTAGLACNDITGSILSSIGVDLSGGLDPCIGSWGPLYPRQMQTDGVDILTSAATAAYRALHIAGYSTGTMPYRVDLGGKLKWVSPVPTLAMTPGTPKELFNAGQFVTPNSQYGFTWWAPVSCCKNSLTLSVPCVPAIPCQGSSFY